MKSPRLNMIWCVNQRTKAAIAQIQQFEMEYAINEITQNKTKILKSEEINNSAVHCALLLEIL